MGLLVGTPVWAQSSVTSGPTGGGSPQGAPPAPPPGQSAPANGPPVGVADQIQQDFQPMGLQLGDITMRPALTVEALFDSNVYLTRKPSADVAIIEKPAVVVTRSEEDLTLQGSASAALAQYMTTNNDYNDFNVQGAAGYQFTDDFGAVLTLRRALMHLDRSSITSLDQFGPVEFNLTTASLQPQFNADPFVDVLKLEWRYYDFLPQGPFSDKDLSNNQFYVGNRFGYEVTSLWTAFIEPSFEIHRFIQTFDRNGIDHDEQIYGILGGFTYTLPNDMYVELGVGYFWNQFQDTATSKDFGGVSATGTLTWNIDPLLTLSGTIGRSVSDVIDATTFTGSLAGATSEVTTAASIRLDWRAQQNLLAFVGGTIAHDDFPSATLTWNTLSATAGARYYINTNFYAGLQYTYSVRFSSDPQFQFNDNQIFLSLTGQL